MTDPPSPAFIAAGDQLHAGANAELDVVVAQLRPVVQHNGALLATGALITQLTNASLPAVRALAATAVVRLAQLPDPPPADPADPAGPVDPDGALRAALQRATDALREAHTLIHRPGAGEP